MNAASRGKAFIRRGRLKEGGAYLLFLIYRGTFIRGRRLKKGAFIKKIYSTFIYNKMRVSFCMHQTFGTILRHEDFYLPNIHPVKIFTKQIFCKSLTRLFKQMSRFELMSYGYQLCIGTLYSQQNLF